MQNLLGYDKGENFVTIIEKAKIACKNSGQNINDHFVEVSKKVKLGSGAKREIILLMPTKRYLCRGNAELGGAVMMTT